MTTSTLNGRATVRIGDDERAELARGGFCILRGAVPTYLRLDLEHAMTLSYGIQARKIAAVRRQCPDAASLDQFVTLLEDHDQEAAYQALPLVARSQGGRRWAAWDGWGAIAEEMLDLQPAFAMVTPPAPFVNVPSVDRLLYRWHCEAHFYPKRRSFVKTWTPLFRPKHAGNGTMVMARGSHLLGDLPFAEHDGAPNHFNQFEIPEAFFADCERVEIHAEPGDLVIFDPRTVHAGSPNRSAEPSYAAATLVFDVRNDLTLSGNMAATPYGGDYARPGMVVDR